MFLIKRNGVVGLTYFKFIGKL